MCCKVRKQLVRSVLIESSLRCQSRCQYASDAPRRREGGVCKEGQVSHRCWQGIVRLRRRIPFLIFVTKPISFFLYFFISLLGRFHFDPLVEFAPIYLYPVLYFWTNLPSLHGRK